MKQLTYVRHSKNPVIFRGRLVGLLVLGALTPTTPIAAQKTASPPAIDASPPSSWRVPPAELQALTFRELGPFRGGRVTTVTGVAQEPPTFYFGGTGGGVWKTESAGQAWTNISDGGIEVESIGAVAVAPSDPNVLYVGTGSDAIRGNVSTGRGVYRSDDDGETWRYLGLREAGQARRVIHGVDKGGTGLLRGRLGRFRAGQPSPREKYASQVIGRIPRTWTGVSLVLSCRSEWGGADSGHDTLPPPRRSIALLGAKPECLSDVAVRKYCKSESVHRGRAT